MQEHEKAKVRMNYISRVDPPLVKLSSDTDTTSVQKMFKQQTELRQLQSRGPVHEGRTSDNRPLLPETTYDLAKQQSSSDTGDEQVIPIHAYLILTTAVVALSSIGPSLDLQHGVAPVMKIFWRQTGTYLFLLPFAVQSLLKDGMPRLSLSEASTMICVSFCYSVMCVGFVISLEYTSVGNAVIFSNTHALLLLLGRFLVGANVSLSEGGGALVAFTGGVFCTYDASVVEPQEAPQAVDEVSPIWVSFFGDIVAVLSALGGTCLHIIILVAAYCNCSSHEALNSQHITFFTTTAQQELSTWYWPKASGPALPASISLYLSIWSRHHCVRCPILSLSRESKSVFPEISILGSLDSFICDMTGYHWSVSWL